VPICTALTQPGTTGLTANMVATSTQHFTSATSPVTAKGCDIGVYVGNTITGVTITGVTVTGAHDAGILAESTKTLTIKGSTVEANGLTSNKAIPQAFGISLFGVSTSTVTGNTVTGNGRGGIGIMDNGPFDPGAIQPQTKSKLPALVKPTKDTVTGNTVTTNYGGCAIVLATFNTTGSISTSTMSTNTVTGKVGYGLHGPVVGGIVAQTNGSNSMVKAITISGNKVTDSIEAGIIVHAAAPGSSTQTVKVTGNPVVSGNNWGLGNGPTATVGVLVGASTAPGAKNAGTVVSGNTISGQFYGVWSTGATPPTVTGNTVTVTTGGTDFYVAPAPGTGYTQVAADGGVFAYGTAGYYGSMGGKTLNAPIVGVAGTQDQGGYWEAASDGGVFSFGDAHFEGSMGGKPLNAPIVGITSTPYVPGVGGATAKPGDLGYWLVAADGGVFSFGDAGFYGSMGGKPLNSPIVGMAVQPTLKPATAGGNAHGTGYWLVASDGGVFAFGGTAFVGSMGGKPLNAPIVGIAATPDGEGYWLTAADGGTFSYGDSTYHGSAANLRLNKPVVDMTPVGITFSG
ncbi:MAG: right-handed parallel beta-helix repeat-containing protein, partial [Acidimicrobiales bacterium]